MLKKISQRACTIQYLLLRNHISAETAEMLYILVEVKGACFELVSHSEIKNLIMKMITKSRGEVVPKGVVNKTITEILEQIHLTHQGRIFEEVIVRNNLPVLHQLKRCKKKFNQFLDFLNELTESLRAHIESLDLDA